MAQTAKNIEFFLNPFEFYTIPIDDWINTGLNFVVEHFRPFFQAVRIPVNWLLESLGTGLTSIPPTLLILIIVLFVWQLTNRNLVIYTLISLSFIGLIGAWQQAMVSLSLVLTAVIFSIIIGIPLGVIAAQNNRFERLINPVLDIMQTIPTFVYLVPVVMLFGIGEVPGVIATIIYATPPLIRLTNLGIRQVSSEAVEAAIAFGSTPLQVLWEVQFPLAMPAILTGLNQTILFALGMSVITAMIAVPGLGLMVLQGVGRLDVGLASIGGIGIVLLAILLDRITQSIGIISQDKPWYERGFVGWFRSNFSSKKIRGVSVIILILGIGGIANNYLMNSPDYSTSKTQIIRPLTGTTTYSQFISDIVNLGLEELGYSLTSTQQLNPVLQYYAISQNQADFTPNSWEKLQIQLLKNSEQQKSLKQVGSIVSPALQGYQIDRKTAEKYQIHTLDQLQNPEIAKLFDTDGDGKANLIGCDAGWSCEPMIDYHLKTYELQDTVEQDQGQYSALMAETITRYREGKPILYYAWTPNWVAAALEVDQDVIWLEVPFTALPQNQAEITVVETPTGSKNLGFPIDRVRFVATETFLDNHPVVNRFFQLVQIPITDINQEQKQVFQGENQPADIHRHAEAWVKRHHTLFSCWIEAAKHQTGSVCLEDSFALENQQVSLRIQSLDWV
ncbi:MAG: glycine betaine/L-proline ABC transporter substrate-binding protein ProX [Microcoleaceae cyanobacterium]